MIDNYTERITVSKIAELVRDYWANIFPDIEQETHAT